MMRVSIIIPFHKGEAYLRDCLDGLVTQTYRDMEVIVISDHAPEEELACLSEYEHELDLRIYHLSDKTGVAAARNLGLDEACGDYIYFLDSDDYLYEDAIELLVSGAQERDDDITYGKKKPTWFQRSVYLIRRQEEQDAQDQEEEKDENDLESPELKMEDDKEEDSQEGSENSDDTSDDD
ncbi:MAG: glycosyltransferase, partial [Clostridiales bacterium]|nr:glycosyltransferase [Clostridiales bacterium]